MILQIHHHGCSTTIDRLTSPTTTVRPALLLTPPRHSLTSLPLSSLPRRNSRVGVTLHKFQPGPGHGPVLSYLNAAMLPKGLDPHPLLACEMWDPKVSPRPVVRWWDARD